MYQGITKVLVEVIEARRKDNPTDFEEKRSDERAELIKYSLVEFLEKDERVEGDRGAVTTRSVRAGRDFFTSDDKRRIALFTGPYGLVIAPLLLAASASKYRGLLTPDYADSESRRKEYYDDCISGVFNDVFNLTNTEVSQELRRLEASFFSRVKELDKEILKTCGIDIVNLSDAAELHEDETRLFEEEKEKSCTAEREMKTGKARVVPGAEWDPFGVKAGEEFNPFPTAASGVGLGGGGPNPFVPEFGGGGGGGSGGSEPGIGAGSGAEGGEWNPFSDMAAGASVGKGGGSGGGKPGPDIAAAERAKLFSRGGGDKKGKKR